MTLSIEANVFYNIGLQRSPSLSLSLSLVLPSSSSSHLEILFFMQEVEEEEKIPHDILRTTVGAKKSNWKHLIDICAKTFSI